MEKIKLRLNKEKKIAESIEKATDFDIEKNGETSEVNESQIGTQHETTHHDAVLPNQTDEGGVGAPGLDTTRSPLHQNIESILEEELEDVYFSMTEQQQQEFKQKGEETTGQIIELVRSAKATFKKVFKLIRNWLKIIPGVSKFFIEQEAKIKADRILEIDEHTD